MCTATFQPGWGVEAYVTWFAVSNFFVPLVFLSFCYGRIIAVIYENLSRKAGVLNGEGSAQQQGQQQQQQQKGLMAALRRVVDAITG